MGCCSAVPMSDYDEKTGAPIIDPNNYSLGELINTGGFGVVYRAKRKKDHKDFAMKFFGYTENAPMDEEIDMEIELMAALNELDGVLHLEGIFRDTAAGRVSGSETPKYILQPFKVDR